MQHLNRAVIIVAAGRGERFGLGDGPKQYRQLGGRSILDRSLACFERGDIGRIVIVIHPDDAALLATACPRLPAHVAVAHGGATRQQSVLNGLEMLAGAAPDIVLIHDAARPFASAVVERVVEAADMTAGVLPALAVADTLKRSADGVHVSETVPRDTLYGAQTPQAFPFAPILAAHRAAAASGQAGFTDDASIAEWADMPVRLVAGGPENLKITYGRDLATAEAYLAGMRRMIDVRTGNGYDVHQLVPGDHVTLCGVRIAHDMALSGHSDADVGLHALTDALLATCGAGDIGDHFPPTDPQWRGAASRIFVEHARGIVTGKGGRIANADISLICEAPKVAPHRLAMREAIAHMLRIDLERVSVKATTNETIGFVGRREGIAAIATASVIYGEGEP